MKTNETRPAAQPRAAAVRDEPKKKGAFAKVLDRKTEETPATPIGPAALPQIAGRAGKVESTAPACTAPDLDAMVNEIAITLRGTGLREVEVQFDSKTFAGLNVRISKENNRLQVRLQTESAEVSRLLANQTDALVRRLETRGYPAPVVQVKSAVGTSLPQRPRQDGRQDQRRERQK